MSLDAAELDRRINELDRALGDLPVGGTEHRVVRVELAKRLSARYVQFGGADGDRVRAGQICRDVLADKGATADERQAMSLIQPVLTMMAATPAHLLRGRDARPDAEMLRRTEMWRQSMNPAETVAGMQELAGQLGAIPDVDKLPPEMRSVLDLVGGMAGLLEASQREGWNGYLDPELESRLRKAVADAPASVPGLEMVKGLLAWLRPQPSPSGPQPGTQRLSGPRPDRGREPVGDRAAELEAALAGLSADHLLTPVLQRDLAQALVGQPELASPGALRRATELMEQAYAGIDEDHPFYDESVRMLGGALLATAAHDPTEERFARAEQVAGEVLRRSRDGGPADRGSDLFLRAMIGLLRSRLDGDREAGTAVRDLIEAIEVLPADHALRPVVVGQLGAVLADRHLVEGMLEDGEVSRFILDQVVRAASAQADDGSGAFLECVAAVSRITQAVRMDDGEAADAGAVTMRAALSRLPENHMMRSNFELVLAVAGLKGTTAGNDRDRVRAAVTAARQVVGEGTLVGVAPGAVAGLAGAIDVLGGLLDADADAIMASINRMEAALGAPVAFPDQRVAQRALLGKAYLAAVDTGVLPGDAADRAVMHLEEAGRLLVEHRAGVQRHDILRDLASAYRARGDRDRGDRELSRRAAFEALKALTGDVLLQSGVGHSVVTARGASADASVLARWCLDDDEPAEAVQAVELGRGLALHAATSALRVPDLLRRLGRPELAQAWEREADARREDPAPWISTAVDPADPAARAEIDHARAASDLRHQVLDVLRGTPEGARLLTAPSTADVGRALAEVGADALVYLVPGDARGTGYLLVIGREGGPVVVDAPGLCVEADGVLADFLRTSRPDSDRIAERDLGHVVDRAAERDAGWRAALEGVCDWAGAALLQPLLGTHGTLDGVRAGGPHAVPRVVLVPGGVLGAVPWQAARIRGGAGRMRYACADLVLSTAASARQLLDVTERVAMPLDLEPVLVSDPNGGLLGAVAEVLALRAAFYPNALVLGDLSKVLPAAGNHSSDPEPLDRQLAAGSGTPDEVLSRLPGARSLGASLLHLACHATTADTAEASHLELTTPLSIQVVLEHAAGRAVTTPGPVVVLSACQSDLTEHDYDEALTLATAFLAAGAVTVVGSRWKVDDPLTAVLMFAFHHFLNAGRSAADALRSTQLWMLDPGRPELPGMPEDMLGDIDVSDLTDVSVWAAFGHHGR